MASKNGSGCLTIIIIILILYACETSSRVRCIEEKVQQTRENTRRY